MPEARSVAVWPERAWVIVPADDQDPGPKPGSKLTAVASVVAPFLPPVTSSLPPGREVTVCASRGPGSAASVLNADCAGSNRNTPDCVAVPLLPPTTRTLLLSCWLLVTSRDAVWFLTAEGSGP